ncbi:hypothetical protein [Thermoflexus sp.]|uniref:hypothetical protein n=1 Tax=Thermoflexus sp. TaxID=1969742 RepID=UPI0035E40DA8
MNGSGFEADPTGKPIGGYTPTIRVRATPWALMALSIEGAEQDLTVILRVVPKVYRDDLPWIPR